jgi:hypothetical protein
MTDPRGLATSERKTVNHRLPLTLQESVFWPLMVLVTVVLAVQTLEVSKLMNLLS